MKGSVKWKVAQKLEIRWWRRYLKKKDITEYLEWKRAYWRRFLKPLGTSVDLSGSLRILDAGCGPAGIFTILEGHEVTAIDPLLGHYESDLSHFNKSDYPAIRFIETPLELYRPTALFQLVFCLNAINHVSDLHTAMQVLFDCLDSKGKLVMSIDCHRYPFLRSLFRLIPGDALHPHQDNIDDYRKMIHDFGGRIILEHKEKPGRIFDYYVLVIEKG